MNEITKSDAPCNVRLRDVAASEWTKIRTDPFLFGSFAFALFVLPLFAVLASMQNVPITETATKIGLSGTALSYFIIGGFGVLVISAEYPTKLIHLSLAAVPRRIMLMAAKAIVVTTSVVIGTVLASALAVGATHFIERNDHAIGSAVPAIAGTALAHAAVALLGLSVGALLRSTAGGLVSFFTLTLLPGGFAQVLPDNVQPWMLSLAPAFPFQALRSLGAPTAANDLTLLPVWQSLATFCAYSVILFIASVALFVKRDA